MRSVRGVNLRQYDGKVYRDVRSAWNVVAYSRYRRRRRGRRMGSGVSVRTNRPSEIAGLEVLLVADELRPPAGSVMSVASIGWLYSTVSFLG